MWWCWHVLDVCVLSKLNKWRPSQVMNYLCVKYEDWTYTSPFQSDTSSVVVINSNVFTTLWKVGKWLFERNSALFLLSDVSGSDPLIEAQSWGAVRPLCVSCLQLFTSMLIDGFWSMAVSIVIYGFVCPVKRPSFFSLHVFSLSMSCQLSIRSFCLRFCTYSF